MFNMQPPANAQSPVEEGNHDVEVAIRGLLPRSDAQRESPVVVVAWFALIFLGFGLFALRCLAVTLTTVPVGKKQGRRK
jgi:hypothetical protein